MLDGAQISINCWTQSDDQNSDGALPQWRRVNSNTRTQRMAAKKKATKKKATKKKATKKKGR